MRFLERRLNQGIYFYFVVVAGSKLKALYYEDFGFTLWYRRLEKGKFIFPRNTQGHIELTKERLNWLMASNKHTFHPPDFSLVPAYNDNQLLEYAEYAPLKAQVKNELCLVDKMRALKQEKLLFLYDRGHPSLHFIQQHQALNVDFVFRLQRGMYKTLWSRVEQGETDFDHLITTRDGAQITVRVVALTLNTGEVEVLITSLFSRERFTWNDITRIYTLRWHIEECYKRLKISAELENFSGNRLEAVPQEFWAHLVMCNILSLHLCDAKGAWDPDNIPDTRLNFSVLFGLMKVQFQKIMMGDIYSKRFQKFFNRTAKRAKVKVRQGRCF